MHFGKLEKIDLRKGWNHEAYDFTQWLAQPENMQILSDEIGIEIDVIETESKVGNFSVDIYAEEIGSEDKIIIENQLEKTNHDHLGKIITYASGLDAKTMIWIFKEIKPEHRQAMDWLNEITDDSISFFAIKLELWKIDDSNYAPKFNIICSPNHWTKTVKKASQDKELTEVKEFNLEFWEGYADYISQNSKVFNPRKSRPQHWYDLSMGVSKALIRNILSVTNEFIRIEVYINDDKELFDYLYLEKQIIEEEIGEVLLWERLSEKKASKISIRKDLENNIRDYEWLLFNDEKLQTTFLPRIKEFYK